MSLHAATFSKAARLRSSFTPARSGILQRKCACGGGGSAGLTGKCEECDSNKLQRKAAAQQADVSSGSTVPDVVHQVLKSSGQPLDASMRAAMEPRFGHDFSRVRVHTDARAAESAESVHALAYTVGRDVVFGKGQYAPQSETGRRLLAHELAHVVQQDSGALPQSSNLQVGPAGDSFEQEADSVADTVAATPPTGLSRIVDKGGAAQLSRMSPGLQRSVKEVEGTIAKTLNLAERTATGRRDAGQTDFVLNGVAFTEQTPQSTAIKALNTPGITSTDTTGGKECGFSSEPTNVVSYQMQLLKDGNRWTYVTTKKFVAEYFAGSKAPGFSACAKGGDGFSTLSIEGTKGLGERVKKHEEQHVKDYKKICRDVLIPWDKKVTDVLKKNEKTKGKDEKTCESILYAGHVGANQTPSDIVLQIGAQISQMAKNFHGLPEGRNVNTSLKEVKDDCNNAIAESD